MKYVLVIVAILLVGLFLFHLFSPPASPKIPSPLQTGPAPWPPDTKHLREHLADIGLPALASEGVALHTHQHLDIFINNQAVTIPARIGIGPDNSFISPIHTHDTTGFIHVESPTVTTYTLGQFFDIWGVRFSDTCLGGYCHNSSQTLSLYSNGRKIQNNFRSLTLSAHQEIVLIYGTSAALPSPIPTGYIFPPDY